MISCISRVFASRQFIKFVLVGGFAALINFTSRIGYSLYVNFSEAIVAAYITGMITAFTLNKLLVFTPSRHHTAKQVAYFTLVNVAALGQTWLVSMLLYHYVLNWLDITLYNKEISHFVGIAIPVFTSYVGHKHLTFKT